MTSPENVPDRVAAEGCAVLPAVLSAAAIGELKEALERGSGGPAASRRGESAYAMRNLLQLVPEARAAACSGTLLGLAQAVLGAEARPVRGILFDKTPDANWAVGCHQDLVIAVRERVDEPGFGGWSVKAGIPHCHPPIEVLEQMLTLRVHLDETGAENAPLRVLPGSHLHGKLDASALRDRVQAGGAVSCAVPAGGVLVMRPLLLHASSPARVPARRRVLHLEYAGGSLPGALRWPEIDSA